MRSDPYSAVIELPKVMTEPQWYSLEDWADFILDRGTTRLTVCVVDGPLNEVRLDIDTTARELVNLCKRAYSSNTIAFY